MPKNYDKNYYKILQVDWQASIEVIEASYKRLSRIHHPDVNQDRDTTDEFKLISEAHSVLKSDRKRYDEYYVKVYVRREAEPNAPPGTKAGNVFVDGKYSHNSIANMLFREIPDEYKMYSSSNDINNLILSIRKMRGEMERLKALAWREQRRRYGQSIF